MKLKLEKDLKVAIEMNGQKFISFENGVLYQNLDEVKGDMFLYIKSNTEQKEIKIRIVKNAEIVEDETAEI